jgi:hypothetical protein
MEEEKPGEKKLSPFTLIGGAAASVTWMLVGSLFGAEGTIYGAALGSVTTTAGAYWYENAARKAQAKLQARKKQDEADAEGTHYLQDRLKALPLGEEALIHARTKRSLHQQGWAGRKKFTFFAGMLALCVASAIASLFVIESATGQTVHSVLTNQKQYGTTFGGYSTEKPSAPHVTPRVIVSGPATISPSATASASSSPTSSPSPSPTPTLQPSAAYTGVSQ